MRLIKDPQQTDPAVIAEIAPIPARIQRMKAQWQQFEDEVKHIKERLVRSATSEPEGGEQGRDNSKNEHPNRGGRKKLRIKINWPLLGKPDGTEIICEHLASASLVRFASRLSEVLGPDVLEKLSRLRINRGPFVTKNPKIDYWNPADQDTYQHQPVRHSGFFILTHSETSQKVKDVSTVGRFLKLPPRAIIAEAVDKSEA